MARIGAGASGYIAILSDVTLPVVPMGIFCMFSLFAGVLIYFLPETRDLPLPDTMWDAVTMLKNNNSYKCTGGINKQEPLAEEEEEGEKPAEPRKQFSQPTAAAKPPPRHKFVVERAKEDPLRPAAPAAPAPAQPAAPPAPAS